MLTLCLALLIYWQQGATQYVSLSGDRGEVGKQSLADCSMVTETLQHNTVRYSIVQYSTVQYSTVQYSALCSYYTAVYTL